MRLFVLIGKLLRLSGQTRWGAVGALLAAGVLVFFGLVSVGYVFFPLQTQTLRTHWGLRWAGAHPVKVGDWQGWERNTCSRESPCRCVLLIHGYADTALTWRKLLEADASRWQNRFRLVAPEIPELGTESPQSTAQRVARAVRPLCSSWIVVGNSLGGWVAAWMALESQNQVERLVLAAPTGLKPVPGERFAGQELFQKPSLASLQEFQRLAYHQPRVIPETIWKKIWDEFEKKTKKAKRFEPSDGDYLDSRLGLIQKPTLILWGKSDRVLPRSFAKRFEQGVPGVIFQEIEACGHLPQKECPDVLVRAITLAANLGII